MFQRGVVLSVVAGIFLISSSLVLARESKLVVFDNQEGGFVRFVNFSFTVPSGQCGVSLTYKWEKGFWGNPGSWVVQTPGVIAEPGFYLFDNFGCPNMYLEISGEMSDLQEIPTWQALEIEPADVGLFCQGSLEPFNPGLPTADGRYDLQLLMPAWNVQSSLSVYLSSHFIYMGGELVAAIVSNGRGFLDRIVYVWDKDFPRIMVDQDDIIVLIYNLDGSSRKQIKKDLVAAKKFFK